MATGILNQRASSRVSIPLYTQDPRHRWSGCCVCCFRFTIHSLFSQPVMHMTLSMTAFARRECPTSRGELAWELRSVNHRYLEVALRLPEELRGLEPVVREQIAGHVTRGRVDATLHWRAAEAGTDALELNAAQPNRVAQ